jgi:photosystem II stability/assembly factor-like uncharacterized protein
MTAARRGRGLVTAALVLAALLPWLIGAAPQNVVPSLMLFAGTPEGLRRSADWGQSWGRVSGRSPGVTLDGLGAARAIRPLGPQVWLGGDGGLFLSDDWGDTWAQLSPTPGVNVVLPSRWPNSDPTVFLGTRAGLMRSDDGGRAVAATRLECPGVRRLDWPGPALAVACDRGLFVTVDAGEHFTGPGTGLPDSPVLAMVLSSYFVADPVAFAAPRSGGVYRTSDGGATWRSAGPSDERVFDLLWIGRFLYAAGETALYRSEDVGATWKRLSTVPGRPARLLFPLGGIEGFLATDRGVFRTPDAGERWEPAGLAGLDVLEIATFPAPEEPSGKRRR